MTYKIQFRTSHSQFYLSDEGSPAATDSNEFWTEEAFTEKLAIEEGILGVCIGTYSHVKCEILLLPQRPSEINFDKYDQVVEGSLEIKSGILQVLDCPNSTIVLQLNLSSGFYRVRVSTFGLDSIVDEDVEANDGYLIKIWPEMAAPRKVLKSYPHPY